MKYMLALVLALAGLQNAMALEIKTPSERIEEIFKEYGDSSIKRAAETERRIKEQAKEQSEARAEERRQAESEKAAEQKLLSKQCQFWSQQEQTARTVAKVAEHCF